MGLLLEIQEGKEAMWDMKNTSHDYYVYHEILLHVLPAHMINHGDARKGSGFM
jgi:hypothetical protein